MTNALQSSTPGDVSHFLMCWQYTLISHYFSGFPIAPFIEVSKHFPGKLNKHTEVPT